MLAACGVQKVMEKEVVIEKIPSKSKEGAICAEGNPPWGQWEILPCTHSSTHLGCGRKGGNSTLVDT